MAEGALKKLKEQLECAICLQTYSEPKLLQCNHVYCQSCLEGLVDRDQQRPPSLVCPNCRQATPIPSGGVASLHSAFQVNSLLEIQELMTHPTPSLEGSATGVTTPVKATSSCCSKHLGEELRLFCETCGVLICFKCAIKSGQHHSHNYDVVNESFMKYKGEVVSLLGPLEGHRSTIAKALDSVKAVRVEITKHEAVIEADIQESINKLHEAIDVRKIELLSELQLASQGKLQSLAVQEDRLDMCHVQLGSCLVFMKNSLEQVDGGEVLVMKSSVMNQVRELTAEFKPDMLKASTVSDITFSCSPNATEVLQNFGSITAPELSADRSKSEIDLGEKAAAILELEGEKSNEVVSFPDPTKCYVVGNDLEVATAGEESVAVLHVINSDLQLPRKPVESIECELVSEVTGTTEQGEVKMVALWLYELRYKPSLKGRHQLHVKVNGEFIDRSPFPVAVSSPVSDLGTLLQKIDGVKGPWGVAVTKMGEVVVSAHDEHCVYVFKPNGEKIRSFGTQGSKEAEFHCPRGVAIDGQGAILVADYKNHRIQKFSLDGKFIKSVGSKGSGQLQFKGPKDIAFNTFNNMVYIVDENHRVQILTSGLTHYGSFGKLGWGKGQFNDPWGVACDSTGKVYVTDSTNNRVEIFAADGMYTGMIGGHGKDPGKFIFPAGVAIDSSDTLYVSERYNHRVSVFSVAGDFVTLFGSFGRGPKEMKYPRGLAVDNSGVVCVCDNNNNRICMF